MNLFRSKSYDPICHFGREFKLSDITKQKEFQAKLNEIYIYQKFCERVQQMCDDFATFRAIPDLVKTYQSLDYEMVCALWAAANHVGRADIGYQRFPELFQAGCMISLWQFILQSLTA